MIRKRGKTYTVQVEWSTIDEHGNKKRHQKSKGGFKTKREAQLYEDQLNLLKANGKLTNFNPLFTKYFDNWVDTYRAPGKQPNTVRRYNYCKKVVNEYFTGVKIKSITRNSFQRFLNDYGLCHAKTTVTKTVRVIESSLADAVADNIINDNPCLRTSIVYDESKGQRVEYPSVNEIKALVSVVRSNLQSRYVSRFIILFLLYTGARVGEAFGLAWSDIDFDHKTIHIQHSWDYQHKHLKGTKNKSSNRIITAPTALLDVLKMLRQNDSKYVFIKPDRIPASANLSDDERLAIGLPTTAAVNDTLRRCIKQAGLSVTLHVHSLRHVHVAYLYGNGVDWYSIAKRLGHASVKTTMDYYAYLIDEKKAKSDKQIDKLIDNLN